MMSFIFNKFKSQYITSWTSLSDVSPTMIAEWNHRVVSAAVDTSCLRVKHRMTEQDVLQRKASNDDLILISVDEITLVQTMIKVPHVFLLTDNNGVVIELIGSDSVKQHLDDYNVGTGTSFALEKAGINGISIAMQLEQLSVVMGSEHSLKLFAEWSCICVPIRLNGNVKGYVDISLPIDQDVTFAIALMKQMAERIEEKLVECSPVTKKELVYAKFDEYQLTSREREIGFHWLDNKTVREIASMLFIAEGTVRNTLKKVYKKTDVSSKGEYFLKFLN